MPLPSAGPLIHMVARAGRLQRGLHWYIPDLIWALRASQFLRCHSRKHLSVDDYIIQYTFSIRNGTDVTETDTKRIMCSSLDACELHARHLQKATCFLLRYPCLFFCSARVPYARGFCRYATVFGCVIFPLSVCQVLCWLLLLLCGSVRTNPKPYRKPLARP